MKFIKTGRIYWITPKEIPGTNQKERPAIALFKYDEQSTIFVQLGSTNSKIPSSVLATSLFRKSLTLSKQEHLTISSSNIHLDISKPEQNSSVNRPHIEEGKFLQIEHNILKEIRKIYFSNKTKIEQTRIKKAKVNSILDNLDEAKKQLIMLKELDPKKYSKLNIENEIRKYQKL